MTTKVTINMNNSVSMKSSFSVPAAVELIDNIHQQLQRCSYLLLEDLNFLFSCCSNKQNISQRPPCVCFTETN